MENIHKKIADLVEEFLDSPLEYSVLIFCFAFVALLLCFCAVSLPTESKCLAMGYRSSNVDYTFTRYCVKRVDQTDIVVPLGIAEARR